MKKVALGCGVVIAVVLAALVLFATRTPALPPGFVSLRASPTFQPPALLEKAWALPVAATYPRPLLSQTNPTACGPTSVANLLRSGGEATSQPDEVAAHGPGCVNGFCFGGLTLDDLAEAARQTSPLWKVTVVRPATVNMLRDHLRRANEAGVRVVVNFNRFPLFGTGGGHHSPVGGYLEAEDLVFVLDVNATYGPWLVSTARLFEAMNTIDSASEQKRGLLLFER